jgi:hypothetical protein
MYISHPQWFRLERNQLKLQMPFISFFRCILLPGIRTRGVGPSERCDICTTAFCLRTKAASRRNASSTPLCQRHHVRSYVPTLEGPRSSGPFLLWIVSFPTCFAPAESEMLKLLAGDTRALKSSFLCGNGPLRRAFSFGDIGAWRAFSTATRDE